MAVILETSFLGAFLDWVDGQACSVVGGTWTLGSGGVSDWVYFDAPTTKENNDPTQTRFTCAYGANTLTNTEIEITLQKAGDVGGGYMGAGFRLTDAASPIDGYFFGYDMGAEAWQVKKAVAGSVSLILSWAESLASIPNGVTVRYCNCDTNGVNVDFDILDATKVSQATGSDTSSPFLTLGASGMLITGDSGDGTGRYNYLKVTERADLAPPSSPNVNPTGISLQTLVTGIPVITLGSGPADVTLNPTGDALTTLASDVLVVDIENTGNTVSPVGSGLTQLGSGVTTLQITLAPVDTSPTGSTTSTMDENSSVDIHNPVQLFLEGTDGNGFFALTSGIPLFTGQTGDLTLRPAENPLDTNTISEFGELNSGTPVLSVTGGQNVNANPVGSIFPLLQPQPPIEPDNTSVQFAIDTDLVVSIANEGSALPTVGSGALSFTNLQTGVLGTLPGNTLGLLASSTAKFAFSHPTAPPGTAGGSLIIRSITQTVTRPVTLTTEIQIARASG